MVGCHTRVCSHHVGGHHMQAVSQALRRILPPYVVADEEVEDDYDPHAGVVEDVPSNLAIQDGSDDPCEPGVAFGGLQALSGVQPQAIDVDAVSRTSKTALFMAASAGKHATVRMLLVCSADHTVLSKRKKNPLYAAVEGGTLRTCAETTGGVCWQVTRWA